MCAPCRKCGLRGNAWAKGDLFHFVWNDTFLDFIASGAEEEGERLQLAVDLGCSMILTFPHAAGLFLSPSTQNYTGLLSLRQDYCRWEPG